MISNIGIELLSITGGTAQSVYDFQRAVPNSRVFALCCSHRFSLHNKYRDDWRYIRSSNLPILKSYEVSVNPARSAILDDLRKSSLIFSHMLFRYNANLVIRVAKEKGVPYCVVPHGSMDPWVFTYGRLQKKLWMWLVGRAYLRGASAVIFATEEEKRKANLTFPLSNGIVINWPVDIPDPTSFPQLRRTVRQRLGIPDDARVLLLFGRIHSCKRSLEALQAFSAVVAPNLHLICVGPTQDVTREQCIAAVGAARARFHWVGPAFGDAKTEYFAASDAYLTLSAKENFNYCLAECLGAGLAAIVSPGNDLNPELISVDCGWMLKTNEHSEAVEAIRSFVAVTDDELTRMKENGRRHAAAKFSRDVFSARLRGLADAILERSKAANASCSL